MWLQRARVVRWVARWLVVLVQLPARALILLFALVPLLSACVVHHAEQPVAAPLVLPEGGSGWSDKAAVAASRHVVAAAHPLAAEAGLAMLRAGGSALDAAIAAQMVLTLVEPQSSGIGGGAFLMHAKGAQVQAWDGRETAPAAAHERLFMGADNKPLPFAQTVLGGRAVAVPGAVRMLQAAHQQHGSLPWARLFEPALALAEGGFEVSHRLHTLLLRETALRADPQARAYFYATDGQPHPVGHRLRNPALAAVFRTLAQDGADALHSGPLAKDLVTRVRGHAVPGLMTAADMAGYTPVLREALCTVWQQRWRVCGFPPPSSGHLAVMQILGLLQHLPAPGSPSTSPSQAALQLGVPSADWLHLYTEAARLAYADRAQYVADPAFVPAPAGHWHSLLDDAYLRQRAALVGARSMQTAQPGQPAGAPWAFGPMPEQPEHGTSHISVVDAQGRAVAMTTTIEAVFGARLMADGGTGLPGGYLLNNQMTDFSALPFDAQGRPVANRIQPGKRPRSSMSPTLVFDNQHSGQLVLTLGSPGGPAIIHFTAKTLLAHLAWGLDVQQAVALPNFGSFNGPTVLEKGRFSVHTLQALRDLGHGVLEAEMTSGLQAIQRTRSGWLGGADPRREGAVRGD